MTGCCVLCQAVLGERIPAHVPEGWPYPICDEHRASYMERARKPAPQIVVTFGAASLEQVSAAAVLLGERI